MAKRHASFFPQGAKLAVRNRTMFGNVEGESCVYAELGTPAAAGTVVHGPQDMTAAATVAPLLTAAQQTEQVMGRFGRAVSAVASGASTGTVTIRGRDYLQQPMSEQLTLNGTTPVPGKKAFRYVDSVQYTATAGITMTLTTANVFGLPYKMLAVDFEGKNGAPTANAGVFVPGLSNSTPSTATTNDVRGTYAPATVLPDGVNNFQLRYFADYLNADGNAQFFA